LDKCTGCNFDINIFDEAYYQLATKSQDRINVELGIVSCDFSAPLAVQNKEGTSAYWFSMQVQNANWPVYDMDVSIDGGRTWTLAVSRDYNFFEHPTGQSFGASVVDLRITCSNGKVVEMKGVSVAGNSKQYATSNC
jgi:expansin (peptidoglycan-binding protein)